MVLFSNFVMFYYVRRNVVDTRVRHYCVGNHYMYTCRVMGNFEHKDMCLKSSRIYGTQFAPAIYAVAQRSIHLFFSMAPQGALSEQGTVNQNTHLCVHKSHCNGLLCQIVTTKKMY